MKVETLRNSDSVKVTVHFDDISAKEALNLSRSFQKLSKDEGLFVARPNKFDHLEYTDLFFRVPDQPDGWKETFMNALQQAVDEKGWHIKENDDEPTIISLA